MTSKRKYFVGQVLIYRDRFERPFWTRDKKYKIISKQRWENGYEIRMIRDNGEIGLWWDFEADKAFITIRELRKEKLEKLSKIG